MLLIATKLIRPLAPATPARQVAAGRGLLSDAMRPSRVAAFPTLIPQLDPYVLLPSQRSFLNVSRQQGPPTDCQCFKRAITRNAVAYHGDVATMVAMKEPSGDFERLPVNHAPMSVSLHAVDDMTTFVRSLKLLGRRL